MILSIIDMRRKEMQSRQIIDFKTILKGMMFLALFMFLQSVPSYAAAGDLKINNQVIYEKNAESQKNATTFTINQLFMTDMSNKDQQLNKEQTEIIASAQKELFLKETPKEPTIEQHVTPILFSKDYALNDHLDSDELKLGKENHVVFILGGIVGGCVVLGLGILLGRSFPSWVKKG